MNFIETWAELEKLFEWKYSDGKSIKQTNSIQYDDNDSTTEAQKNYEVTYYDGGVKQSFTVSAKCRSEAEQIAWSKVDADSLYVTELS
jgi:hypothetical protein